MTPKVLSSNTDLAPHAWIVDASPFIGLAKVGLLDLLTGPGREVFITDTVRQEVMSGTVYDIAQRTLDQGWGLRVASPPLPPELAALRLDGG